MEGISLASRGNQEGTVFEDRSDAIHEMSIYFGVGAALDLALLGV